MPQILLVDDDPDILKILSAAFESAGHEVCATVDSREVKPLMVARRFDAVVLDVMMPRRSGWEILEDLRRDPRTERLPVLMLSAIGDAGNRVRGIRNGADDFLGKPFHPEEILARVEGLLERRALESQGLQGDFDSFAPDEVLQALQSSRASGILEVSTPLGDGCLRFSAGRCLEASFAGLDGGEAVVALLKQGAGSFRLRRDETDSEGREEELPVLNLLLEAAWIDDELRLRRVLLPAEGSPLRALGNAGSLAGVEDLPRFPAADVLALLEAQPGKSLGELLALRLAAPDRVRLAVAMLIEAGLVREEGTEGADRDDLGELLAELAQETRLRGLPDDPLEIALLIEPRAWQAASPFLAAVSGEPRRDAPRQAFAGGFEVHHAAGELRLHVASPESPSAEPWLRRSAAVILWLAAGSPHDDALAAALARRADPRAYLLLIAPGPLATLPERRVRVVKEAPRDVAGLLSAILSPLQE